MEMGTFRLEGDPHAGQAVLTAGPAAEHAKAALILLHGRGGTAESILGLYLKMHVAGVAALAPRAANNSWYPKTFLSPIEANQPYLDSALRRVDALVHELMARGVPGERIAILGFSQGACLTSEYVARHPRRYGAVMPLTGGFVGPPGTPRNYTGSLEGTPVFMGTSDPDSHVPVERVEETATVLQRLGAIVELRKYSGLPHTVNEDELLACRVLVEAVVRGSDLESLP
jgi:predicted esterase